MLRIPESALVIPTLYLLKQFGDLSTSALIKKLRNLMKPSGEDLKILDGRKDDKFTVVPYVKTVFNTNLRWFPS